MTTIQLPTFKTTIPNTTINTQIPYNITPIPYDTVTYDYDLDGTPASNFDTTTYTYNVPLTGTYTFSFSFVCSTISRINAVFLSVNNTTTYPNYYNGNLYLVTNNQTSIIDTNSFSGTITLRLNQNDKVSIAGYFNNLPSSLVFNESDYLYNTRENPNTGGIIQYLDSTGQNPQDAPYDTGYALHTFEVDGNFFAPFPLYVEYFIVGGGGAGGKNRYNTPNLQNPTGPYVNYYGGGGGGAGISKGYLNISPNTNYSVTIGLGGTSPKPYISNKYGYMQGLGGGLNGGTSSFSGILAVGGGGGGGGDSSKAGSNGYCGGGAGTLGANPGSGISGFNGSTGTDTNMGGGGGGAISNGVGASGGIGFTSDFNGYLTRYSDGGGSNTSPNTTFGSGGVGDTGNSEGGDGIRGVVFVKYPYNKVSNNINVNWFSGTMISY